MKQEKKNDLSKNGMKTADRRWVFLYKEDPGITIPI